MIKFFDYLINTNNRKIQLKRPYSKKINNEVYHFISLRHKNQEIYIKTPKIVIPFGLNTYVSNQNDKHYYYVLSFSDADIDPNIDNFNKFCREMELFCQNTVEKSIKDWDCSYMFENLTFKSSFKEADGFDPLFRLKITNTGKQPTELYDEYQKPIEMDKIEEYVTERCQIISLLELNNIWINSSEYGLTWKVRQMRIYPNNKPIGGISLLDENVQIHHVKIVEHTQLIPMAPPMDDQFGIPEAPPMDFDEPAKPYIPTGGRAILPFLSMIGSGQINLKKVDENELNKSKVKRDDIQPLISLSEILSIKDRLKKSK